MTLNTETPTFQSLAQAVGFIAERLECDAPEELLATFANTRRARPYKPFEIECFTGYAFPALQKCHQEMDLRVRYTGQDFDPALREHQLGGHMQELGCIHIDFVKTASGWVLEEIWLCR
ncbi:MAG: hypothetical protein JW726_09625 [Anaerolineales bacterium]|nr:hypothetical protein [Anaerolineales bacterium]